MFLTYLRSHHVALLALFVALGGTSYAVARLPKNSVSAAQIKKDAITSVKVKNHSLLAKDFKAGQLPSGARGADGTPGAPGRDATKLWAVVTAAGALSRSSVPGISAVRSGAAGAGAYLVTFPQDVTQCAWIAVIGSPGSGTQDGDVEVEGVSGQPNQVFVGTSSRVGDGSGTEDRGFHLAVFC
jgi:hypothetical protein